MGGRPTRGRALGAGLALVLLAPAAHAAAAAGETARQSAAAASASPSREGDQSTPGESLPGSTTTQPRAYLIYLTDGGEPIVVSRYTEEDGLIRFEKYGGWVGIPKYEIFRIVPDEPDRTEHLLPLPVPAEEPAQAETMEGNLYVSLRGGTDIKATGVRPEGDRVRVVVPDGSFTVPRSDLLGVVRMPRGPETPEAWLTVMLTATPGPAAEASAPPAQPEPPTTSPPPPALPVDGTASRPAEAPAQVPPVPSLRLQYPSSNRPHLVRLTNGQVMRVDGFWVEDGQIRVSRLGGMIGMALSEVVRLIPEEIAPVAGRTSVRFVRQLGPDLLEVRAQGGVNRIRLLGVEPVQGKATDESPWRHLDQGAVVYLEFDRQRYDAQGNWLAYVFLPNNRMLNAELIRLGLGRPLRDGRNVRYLDFFEELAPEDGSHQSR